MRKNPRLKRSNDVEEYSPEMQMEMARCATDPAYFARNYVYIKHPVKGQILFDLYDYQEDLMKAYKDNRYNIVLSARQTGKCVAYPTRVTVIKKPSKIKMFVLWIIDRKKYNEVKEIFE